VKQSVGAFELSTIHDEQFETASETFLEKPMGLWYAAVEDDPLTSGPGSRVYATGKVGTVQGEDGRRRRMAFIGDEAWCAACGSMGFITYGTTGLRVQRRLLDRMNGGRRQAVGDDIVLCKCPTPPRIIANYGRNWKILDNGDDASRKAVPSAPGLTYDEQFVLRDAETRQPLRNVRYQIFSTSRLLAEGTTDTNGCTQRINTDNAEKIRLLVAADL